MFRFKQFNVDQTDCAMKVNTDGVLLGALADAGKVATILDIGTGTGVIALMLAQRFSKTQIDAVELNETAARTASNNFQNSPFACWLQLYAQSFQQYFDTYPQKRYDLIVSNPPFYIQSLKSPKAEKSMAKHANADFFKELISCCKEHLSANGSIWLILPLPTAALVKQITDQQGLFVQQYIFIKSYPHSEPHREILVLGSQQTQTTQQSLIIYDEPKVYTNAYQCLLKNFLTIF